jgi:hypothetical protein
MRKALTFSRYRVNRHAYGYLVLDIHSRRFSGKGAIRAADQETDRQQGGTMKVQALACGPKPEAG